MSLDVVPALKGSLTYARFYVEGDLADDFRERFMKSIRLRAMKPLVPDEEDLERSGWCKIGDPFVTDISYDDVFYNEYINLGFRTDRWQIPAPMLKEKIKEAETAYLAKKGRERLSRKEKNELKDLVSRKLRRQVSPVSRVVDFSWSLNENLIRFFSHAGKPAGTMTELFTKTFAGLKLIPESPYTLATRIGLSKAQENEWQEMEAIVLGSDDTGFRRARDEDDDDDFEAAEEEEA